MTQKTGKQKRYSALSDEELVQGKITAARYVWCDTNLGRFCILVGESQGIESGPEVILYWPRRGKGRAVTINLTSLTKEEFDVLREVVTTAFEWAEDIVVERDKEAKDAWERGDDSFERYYRPLPQLVARKRLGEEHSEGVPGGPSDLPRSDRGRGSEDGRVRGAGDGLAESDSRQDQAEDNGSQTD